MKLGKIYEFVIREGMKKDPRGLNAVKKALKEAKNRYRKLKGFEKSCFDMEGLRNPYSDTRILYGDLDREIKKILVGIDIGPPEILMADRLNQKGESIDLAISHHPHGQALAGLHEVMSMQEELLIKAGITPIAAKDLVKKRICEVERNIQSSNHARAVDVAKLLDMPFMCIHTASDNFVASFLQNLFDRKKPKLAESVVSLLNRLPEYKEATIQKAGPKIIVGKKDSKAGKILVEMTGGTEGPENVFSRFSQAGIGTLVCMHLSEKHFAKVRDEHLNVVIAGHIASDNLGLNLLLDRLENKTRIKILTCSGFRRVRRRSK